MAVTDQIEQTVKPIDPIDDFIIYGLVKYYTIIDFSRGKYIVLLSGGNQY